MRKSLKKVMVGALCLAILFIVAGCGDKSAMSASDFKSTMEGKGYLVQDATDQFAEYDHVKQVYIAQNPDAQYQIEFYDLADEDTASMFFNNNKAIFENSKSSSSAETSVEAGNHAKYTLSSNGHFKVVSRIDNTAIYLDVEDGYKSEIKELLDEFGY